MLAFRDYTPASWLTGCDARRQCVPRRSARSHFLSKARQGQTRWKPGTQSHEANARSTKSWSAMPVGSPNWTT